MKIVITFTSDFNEGDTVIFNTGVNAPEVTKIIQVKLTDSYKFLYRLESRPSVFFSADCLTAIKTESL